MYSIIVRNVNRAFVKGLQTLSSEGNVEKSRNGDVLVLDAPMLTTYSRPRERVLFDSARDANPFFHVMEAIWMLAGRDDAAWPTKFNSRMAEYANDEGRYDGAYGFRWRHHFEFDQIDYVVSTLLEDPTTRRAVIAMYDPMVDVDPTSKDIPCNTHIYFRIRKGVLDMTVCNRSNDAVWGAYGANAVHMSMLQELIAEGVGVNVGRYHQLSNNFHLYLDPHEGLLDYVKNFDEIDDAITDLYSQNGWSTFPICNSYPEWFEEANTFLDDPEYPYHYVNNFFYCVARPMLLSWEAHKDGIPGDALSWASQIEDKAWAYACTEWLKRRIK